MPIDNLTTINWSQYHHAYGPATDVPELILALMSEQEETRMEAYETLCHSIWHQGTVYEATAYAVPFLIELLTLPFVKDKDGILYLLQMIALGASYHDAHQSLHSYYSFRKSETFKKELLEQLRWVEAAHDAVEQGTQHYLELLTNEDAKLAVMAPYTLSVCYNNTETILPILRTVFFQENRQTVKLSILCGMAELLREYLANGGTLNAESPKLFESLVNDRSEDPYIRMAAALAIIKIVGIDVISQALQCFAEIGALCNEKLPVHTTLWAIYEGSVQAMSLSLTPYPHIHQKWILETLNNPKFSDTETRKYLVWKLDDTARQSRKVAFSTVPHLIQLITDADLEIATLAGRLLAQMGKPKAMVENDLIRYVSEAVEPLRTLASDVLIRFREIEQRMEKRLNSFSPANCAPTTEILETLAHLKFRELIAALWCLDRYGGITNEQGPLLRQCLQNDFPMIRVLAARLLWTLNEEPALLLPILTYQLHPDPSGFLALEGLGNMGIAAHATIPLLKEIVESDHRWHWTETIDIWNEIDDHFALVARQVLQHIESLATE